MLPEQQPRILGYFIEEAKDHLNTIEQGLLSLQNTINDREMLKEVYRAAHSVKGGAGMLSLHSIQKTSHLLEDCFKLLEETPVQVDQKLESQFWLVFDTLKDLLEHLQGPFGLAEDVAAKLMSTVEPVFTELKQHLDALVNSSRKGTAAKQKDSQKELLASTFKQDVMEQLRQMLQLFKPPAWPDSRPQLEACCDNLVGMGEHFQLASWCNLMEAAKGAIANPENTCQTLAPVIIKDIKAAQELVLGDRADEISVGEQLQALLPVVLFSEEVELFDDSDDLFSLTDESLEFDSHLPNSSLSDLEPDSDLFAEPELEQLAPTFSGKQGRSSTPSHRDLPSPPHIVGAADHHGPEVGAAELNTLADLFEKGVDLDDRTWQEEQTFGDTAIEPAANLPKEILEAESDFADLFDEVSSKGQASELDDPLSLFDDAFLNEEESQLDSDLELGDRDRVSTSSNLFGEEISQENANNLTELFAELNEEEETWEELTDLSENNSLDSELFTSELEELPELLEDLGTESENVWGEDWELETDEYSLSEKPKIAATAAILAAEEDEFDGLFELEEIESSSTGTHQRIEVEAFESTGKPDEFDVASLFEEELLDFEEETLELESPDDKQQNTNESIDDIFGLEESSTDLWGEESLEPAANTAGFDDTWIQEESGFCEISKSTGSPESRSLKTEDTDLFKIDETAFGQQENDEFDALSYEESKELQPEADFSFDSNWDLLELENTGETKQTAVSNKNQTESNWEDDLFADPFAADGQSSDTSVAIDDMFDLGAEEPTAFVPENLDFEADDLFGSQLVEQNASQVGNNLQTAPIGQKSEPQSAVFGEEEQELDWFADISGEESLEPSKSNFENDLELGLATLSNEDSSDSWLDLEATDSTESPDAELLEWSGTENDLQLGLVIQSNEDSSDSWLDLEATDSTESPDAELLDWSGTENDLQPKLVTLSNEDSSDSWLDLSATDSTESPDAELLEWSGTENDLQLGLVIQSNEDSSDSWLDLEATDSTESPDAELLEWSGTENDLQPKLVTLSNEDSSDSWLDLSATDSTESPDAELLDWSGTENDFELELANESTEDSSDSWLDLEATDVAGTPDADSHNWEALEANALSLDTAEDSFDEFGFDEQSLTTADSSTGEIEATSLDFESSGELERLEALLGEEALDEETVQSDGLGEFGELEAFLGEETLDQETTQTEQLSEFDELEAMLGDEAFSSNSTTALASTDSADLDFSELEAMLGDEALKSNNLVIPAVAAAAAAASIAAVAGAASQKSGDTDFSELENMVAEIDGNQGRSATAKPTQSQGKTPKRLNRGFMEQTMKVPVKHMDNLSNLVGELVVNRNTLEEEQERQRQFLGNLLNQVQQLSDVGARMQDLYERSLLEASLLASRHSYRTSSSLAASSSSSQRHHSTGMEFDPTELDRFTRFHELAQDMIELIVRVRESTSDIEFVTDETEQVCRQFRQISTQLQEGLTRARMVPFGEIERVFPLTRYVREKAGEFGKQAEIKIEGRETLIDKLILEHFSDPLKHLVNNAIAHGIETPDVRQKAGKSPTGRITIRAFHQGNQTVITFSDDGGGINAERVKAKAIEKRLITPAQAKEMSRQEVYQLIYHPGFSTKDEADLLAGKGVGMDVVLTSLSEIRGTITTDSTQGKGTSFTIRLPLTLSICKALCCLSDKARIAFPMDGVEDALDIPKDRIQVNAEGKQCIPWRDTLLPFKPLSELLTYNRQIGRAGVYGGSKDEDVVSIVVLRSPSHVIALQVDQVLGEQEIVIKQLEGPIPKPLGIAGATVQGDGRIMPIGDVLELVDLSLGVIRNEGGKLWDQDATHLPPEQPKSEPTVLIVDDSITVRELLSMTFNKVGYRVEQARDGQEAWDKLKSGLPCDLVFCDIEMPRMDGLELLSRLQKDPDLNHLPVAMLTSRGADKHRQMAVQFGASGYFTKPYLEESLLDAASRMLKGEKLVTSSAGA